MAKILGKIVLTGGPCAGKTTALTKIEEELTEKGYYVFIVPESATELINGGINPNNGTLDFAGFQDIIIRYQLAKEQLYKEAAEKLPNDKDCIIIYDRGVVDNKGYIGSEIFNKILSQHRLKEFDLMQNYDIVIHMVTAANGSENYYTLANNDARTESLTEARETDKKIAEAWVGHQNVQIVDNSTGFKEKVDRVLDIIYNYIGSPIAYRKRIKFKIDKRLSDLSIIKETTTNKTKIETVYLNYDKKSNINRTIRKNTYLKKNTYYLRTEKGQGKNKIYIDKKITKSAYDLLLDETQNKKIINKIRYSFILGNQYYKLDMYDNELLILQIEPTKENCDYKLPTVFKGIKLEKNSNFMDDFTIL